MPSKKIILPYRGVAEATIESPVQTQHLESVNQNWRPYFRELARRGRKQDDDHWDWSSLARNWREDKDFTFAVVAGGETQGLLWATKGCSSQPLSEGEPWPPEILVVERLATAPWNRGQPMPLHISQYKLVGTSLLKEAVLLSRELGFQGRVGLHALEDAESFYEEIGMLKITPGTSESMAYFEFDPEGATRFLPS